MNIYKQIIESTEEPTTNSLWLNKGKLLYYGENGWSNILNCCSNNTGEDNSNTGTTKITLQDIRRELGKGGLKQIFQVLIPEGAVLKLGALNSKASYVENLVNYGSLTTMIELVYSDKIRYNVIDLDGNTQLNKTIANAEIILPQGATLTLFDKAPRLKIEVINPRGLLYSELEILQPLLENRPLNYQKLLYLYASKLEAIINAYLVTYEKVDSKTLKEIPFELENYIKLFVDDSVAQTPERHKNFIYKDLLLLPSKRYLETSIDLLFPYLAERDFNSIVAKAGVTLLLQKNPSSPLSTYVVKEDGFTVLDCLLYFAIYENGKIFEDSDSLTSWAKDKFNIKKKLEYIGESDIKILDNVETLQKGDLFITTSQPHIVFTVEAQTLTEENIGEINNLLFTTFAAYDSKEERQQRIKEYTANIEKFKTLYSDKLSWNEEILIDRRLEP